MSYDRDVVVNCIKRHYELLVKAAYFDPAEVLYPPDEGWSDEKLAVDVLCAFRRSEDVIDLLRHLPYIKQLDGHDTDEVYLYTQHMSYLREAWPFKSLDPKFCRQKQLADELLMPTAGEWPGEYISLTRDQHATWWVIDTAKGLAMLRIQSDHQRTDIQPRYYTCDRNRLYRATTR
ncbi:hypothetical protein HBI24_147200 [Parastagonospora nodorum]|nr:hypothetical protein HBH75_091600 [Parastagonospora nodorum]KAH5579759.1 hypothetical protein HBI24_147200 [Parastagonospora nodorum]